MFAKLKTLLRRASERSIESSGIASANSATCWNCSAKSLATIERQPPHGGRRIELLRHRHEGRIMGVEDVDDLGEIGKRPRQPIDFIDNDDLNLAGLDVFQKRLSAGRSIVPPDRPLSQARVTTRRD